jgi:peptide deformylase
MAVKSIKMFNASCLSQKCEAVQDITPEVVQICVDMLETYHHNENKCLGLAANQVGYNKRIIVIRMLDKNKPIAIINPEIMSYSKDNLVVMEEGCLSYPTIYKRITRPYEVRVTGKNIEGSEVTFTAEGLQARIIFHEIDHLNGICKVGKRR